MLSTLKLQRLYNTGCMVSEIFESLFWVGPGFIPKSHLVESFTNDRNEEKDVTEIQDHSTKSGTIVMQYLLGLRNKGKD